MKTQKLYDQNAYMSEFSATVLSCEETDGKYKIILDKTAFFPEAGGQPCDIGSIEDAEVFDVKISENIIYHYVNKPIEEGKSVACKIDFLRRFSFMQNHTGEHIVSGIVNKLYGFDNVGFHLNEEFVTLDFDGMLSRTQLDEIELKANEKIWQNKSVKAYYPSPDELKGIAFRQKKEIDGELRLVDIEDTDICACCAPHVKSTGEIGVIKLLSFEKMRGGIRIYMKCGNLAILDYQNKFENISKIQNFLSAKAEEAAIAVEQLCKKCDEEKQRNAELKQKMIECLVSSAKSSEKLCFLEGFDMKEISILSDRLHKSYGGIKCVFSRKDVKTYIFAICGEPQKADEFFGNFKEALNVKGGGRNGMISGTVNATQEEIEGVISSYELD